MRTYLELASVGGVTHSNGNLFAVIDAAVEEATLEERARQKAAHDEVVDRYRLALEDLRTELSKTSRMSDRNRDHARSVEQRVEVLTSERDAALATVAEVKSASAAEIARLNTSRREYADTMKTGLEKAIAQIRQLKTERDQAILERDQAMDAVKKLTAARRRPKARR